MKTKPALSALTRVPSDKTPSFQFLTKLLCIALLLTVSTSRSDAALDFYESFNYSSVNVQLATATTNWVAYAGGGAHATNTSGSLSYSGLSTAAGDNSVLLSGSGAIGIAARNLSQSYTIANATTVYYSLTLKVTSINTADWGNGAGNWTNGSFMLGFNQKLQNGTTLAQGDAAAPLLIRTGDPNNLTNANDFQEYQLGIGVTATTATRTFDGAHNYHIGDTVFVVASYTFNSGTSDDVAKLYVNPTPGSLEADNTPVIVTTAGAADVTGSQIQSFFLRNNSVEPASTQIDNLRVGTTWADVTPAGAPSLRIELASPNIVLSWPTNSSGFTLETNLTANPTGWGTVPNPVANVGGRFYVTNTISSGNKFFRLRK